MWGGRKCGMTPLCGDELCSPSRLTAMVALTENKAGFFFSFMEGRQRYLAVS